METLIIIIALLTAPFAIAYSFDAWLNRPAKDRWATTDVTARLDDYDRF